MDKYQLIKKIHNMEGLTDDEKSALFELLRTQKKYGIVWEDKPEKVEERLRDELPVLTEVKERAIISEDQEAPNHILIEGDNLEALTTLAYTHAGKIDVIYIDPPYNTGNKDFIYNDKYVDSEDEYRHSKWLSFMSRRLKIAKQLLSEKGVIYISISDIEQYNLRLLCNEIFEEKNFVANLVWSNKEGGGSSDSKLYRTKHEYILVYAKDINNIEITGVKIGNEDRYKQEDDYVDKRGKYYLQKLGMGSIQYSTSLDYPIEMPDGTFVTPSENNNGNKACWRWSKEKYEWGVQNGFVELKKSRGVWTIYTKQYLYCDNDGNLISRTNRPIGIIDSFSSTQGSKTIKSIFGTPIFSYPKDSNLIKWIIERSPNKTNTILDFFAGSGTTLHATMQLNSEDGGKRKCILVTNNENNICEEVTYERNKRVIQGYTTPKGVEVEGLKCNNLRYYKTDFVSRDRDAKTMRRLVDMSTDMLCIKEDLYKEVYTFGSQKTRKRAFRCFAEGDKKMLVIYREELVEDLVEEIFDMDIAVPIKVYVFSPSEDPWGDLFEGVAEKVELCALPQAIYNAYRRILPKRGQSHKRVIEEEEKEKTKDTQQLSLF